MSEEVKKIKVWLTGHALTEGIQCVEAEELEQAGMISYRPDGSEWTVYVHNEGQHWHRTLEGALARAEAMRKKKIASLKKSLAKFEKMTFSVKEKS